ncbi:MAG: hypothetical protein JRJ08_05440, partial [Deltaproteobacteria bacterium]|nr:hypothetical protein [Deltaproteobacteria bacterium]
MKCPKCGFFGPDHLDTCKKCGKDLSIEQGKLGLTSFRVRSFRSRQPQKKEPPPLPKIYDDEAGTGSQRQGSPDKIQTRTEATRPQMVSSPGEPATEEVKKDFDIPQQLVNLKPDQQEGPSIEAGEEDFQFKPEKEEAFTLASIGE